MFLAYKPYKLDFSFAAGTSRGVMHHRDIWILELRPSDTSPFIGLGEVAPLPRLSADAIDQIPFFLDKLSQQLLSFELPQNESSIYELARELADSFPSVRFALEMAMLDALKGGQQRWFDNAYTQRKSRIPINGLIWMGSSDVMKKQIDEKIDAGFECIKMKIGAIDFEEELKVLHYIRSKFDGILRVDANGAFKTDEVLRKLKTLGEFDLHSIEQPIMPRQIPAMQLVCEKSPVPVALDEELIGPYDDRQKARLLDEILPAHIVLKPSLLGGFQETDTWIKLAEERNIGWWMTPALESNLGLNAIAQFTAQYQPTIHQGLGTGSLFENNLEAKNKVSNGWIEFVG